MEIVYVYALFSSLQSNHIQITIVKPVLLKVVSLAKDLVAPLEHIWFERHIVDFIFDREAQSVRDVLFGVILFTVDQLGSVRKPCTWDALGMSVPCNILPILLEMESSRTRSILPRPAG